MVRISIFQKVFLVVVFIAFACPVQGWGATWYVRSSSGAYGAADGTSYATAFDGFSGINWSRISAGDTLYVCGTFTGERNVTGKSGTSGSHIIIDGNCPNVAGVIDGNGTTQGFSVNHNYVTVRNLTIRNVGGNYAIGAGSTSAKRTGVTLDNLTVYNGTSSGIVMVALDSKILNSTVHNISQEGIWAIGSTDQTAGNIEIAYNTLYDIGTTGANTDGIFVGDRGLTPVYIHGNTVTNVLGTGGSGCIDSSNTAGSRSQTMYFYNNYVSGCAYGISVGDQDVADTGYVYYNVVGDAEYALVNRPLGTFYFYNNTVNGAGNSGLWFYVTGNHTLHVKNNTVSGSYTYSMLVNTSSATLDFDYNNYSAGPIRENGTNRTLAQWRSDSGQDAHSMATDPQFVSASDLHLRDTSPLIDAGTNVSLSSDFGGGAVPHGSAPDIGAYEFGSGSVNKVPNAPQIMGIN